MTAPETPDERDPFAVLGVPRDCSPETLHRAYRALARRYHPDVNADAAAVADMRRINAAFVAARRALRARDMAPAVPVTTATVTVTPVTTAPGAPAPTAARPVTGATGIPPRYAGVTRRVARARKMLVRVSARPLWGVGVLLAAGGALALLLVLARIGLIGTSPAAPASGAPALALGQSTTTTWPGLGRVVLREHALASLPAGSYQSPSWSHDDQYVAVGANDNPGHMGHPAILVLDARGHVVRTLPGFVARWAPNADELAILATPHNATVPELDLADVAAGTERTLVAQAGNHLAWSPDGSQIVFSAQAQRVVRVLNMQSQQVSQLYAPPAGEPGVHVLPLGWYDAGDVLCLETSGSTAQLALLQVATSMLTPLQPALAGATQGVAWNTTSGQVLYAAQSPGQQAGLPQVLDHTTGSVQAIPSLRGMTVLAGWSADGAWLGAATPGGEADNAAFCLVAQPASSSPASWVAKCLSLSGQLDGLRWESQGGRLSYLLRTAAGEQLREVTISVAAAPAATSHSWPPAQPLSDGLPLVGVLWAWWFGRRSKAAKGHDATASTARRLRLCVVSEALKWPPDEALKRTALELALALERHGEVLAIGTQGKRHPHDHYPALCLRVNRAFLSGRLWHRLWLFQPDILFYLPGSGLTVFSLARAVVLRLACLVRLRRPLMVLVSIQPRALGRLDRWLLRALGPVRLVVQSPQRGAELARQGFATHVLGGGVDAKRFRPIDPARREALRRLYTIASEAPVILHVGHVKRDRNVDALAELKRRLPGAEVVLVASTSTVSDLALKADLRRAGVRVFDEYLPHVEELYQIADCYVFPVRNAQQCAEFPLSVLEALACGVPTVTTRFGALPESVPQVAGLRFVDTPEQFFTVVTSTVAAGPAGSGRGSGGWATSAYAWERQVGQLMEALRPCVVPSPATQICAGHEGVI